MDVANTRQYLENLFSIISLSNSIIINGNIEIDVNNITIDPVVIIVNDRANIQEIDIIIQSNETIKDMIFDFGSLLKPIIKSFFLWFFLESVSLFDGIETNLFL